MLGSRIKQLRTEMKLTQKKFSALLGVSESMISLYETDRRQPSYDILDLIASKCNVSTDYLLGRTDLKNVNILGDFVSTEIDMIQKYRQLDQRGKKAVNETLDREYKFATEKSVSDEMCAVNCIGQLSDQEVYGLKKSGHKTQHDDD